MRTFTSLLPIIVLLSLTACGSGESGSGRLPSKEVEVVFSEQPALFSPYQVSELNITNVTLGDQNYTAYIDDDIEIATTKVDASSLGCSKCRRNRIVGCYHRC